MHFRIDRAIVGFLINHQSFRASIDDRHIIACFHRADLDRNRGKIRLKSADAFGEIVATDEFRVFASDQKDLTKTLPTEMTRFGDHFLNIKRDAKNWVIPGETAVTTIIDALVRKVKRREETHCPAEILQCERA